MKILFLGTGTSDGVPTLLCNCKVCFSNNPKNKRKRSSLFISDDKTNILIDTSPDIKYQFLEHKINKIDAIFYTHQHFDHVSGLDELRSFTLRSKIPLQLFMRKSIYKDFKKRFYYIFKPFQAGGGIVKININLIKNYQEVNINNFIIKPLPLLHGRLKTHGFLINHEIAYCNDVSSIPQKVISQIKNVKILIIDALRLKPHTTHFNLEQAIKQAYKINAEKTYFIHMTHDIDHDNISASLPKNMYLSYDGLSIEV